ncbi:MAG: uracil-DNA glycosylase [Deltaproteobacteria bacterium]|nr:uracil-DNA glycosylase [Deltaproteobacteria bacterium]
MNNEEYNNIIRLAAKRLGYFQDLGVRRVPFSMPVEVATPTTPSTPDKDTKLAALQASFKGCELCDEPLKKAHVVMGEGAPSEAKGASVVFVVATPTVATYSGGSLMQSRDMDLLGRIIRAMKLEPDEVYITSIVKCVSPSGRPPQREDIKKCLPHFNEELKLLAPKVIVALGSKSADMIISSHGAPKYKTHYRGVKTVTVVHPSDMNRNPELKAEAWKVLQGVMEFLVKA